MLGGLAILGATAYIYAQKRRIGQQERALELSVKTRREVLNNIPLLAMSLDSGG
jgi:hypothetical protein